MTCSKCGGLVEWRGLTSLFGATRVCLSCGQRNGPVLEDQIEEEEEEEEEEMRERDELE